MMPSLELVNNLIMFITSTISNSGYLGIFFLMVAEGMSLPFPSEVILPYSGYLIFTNKLNLWYVIVASSLGNLVGAIIFYFIGSYLGPEFVLRYGKYIFLKKKHVELTERYFQKYGDGSVFIARLLPIVRGPISLPAGLAKMKMKKFIIYTLSGSTIWNLSLIYIGLELGNHWKNILHYSGYFDVIAIVFVLFFIAFLIRKIKSKN